MSLAFGFALPHWQAISGGFSPQSLFTGGVQGVLFDISDLTTLFTTSAGTTPVAMPGQGSAVSVGLMLDKSQNGVGTNGAYRYNLLTYTEQFDNAYWVKTRSTVTANATTAPDGTLTADKLVEDTNSTTHLITSGSATGSVFSVYAKAAERSWIALQQQTPGRFAYFDLTNGVVGTSTNATGSIESVGNGWFRCTITVTSGASTWDIFIATGNGTASYTGNGTSGVFLWGAQLTTASAPTAYQRITDTWYSTMAGNHAIAFNDTTARPELRARVNLLTYSEQFDNGAWVKNALNTTGTPAWVNAAVAPNGTTTADLLLDTASSAEHYAQQSFSCISGVSYTFSGYVKQYTYTTCVIRTWLTGSVVHNVDFSAGTISGGGTLTNVGNGWFRFEITRTASASGTAYLESYVKQTGAYAGTGTDGHYVWGFDVRPANIGANVPAYQRIADANTYDTSGFPLYLRFDGIDDSMYTPANLNLSGTDKVSVFAGVRKLSDAADAVIVELSNNFNSAIGAFLVNYAATGVKTAAALKGNIGYSSGEFTDSAAPISEVLSTLMDMGLSTNEISFINKNGVAQILTRTNNANNTGNYGTYPLYIGSRGNSSLWLNGHLHSLIIAGSAVSAGNISATEQWVAGKTGIVIP